MVKKVLLIALVFITMKLNAQIEVAKLVGKNSQDFHIGYGAFLKFSYPVSDASDITLEGGALIFQEKNNPAYGCSPFAPSKRTTTPLTGKAEMGIGTNKSRVSLHIEWNRFGNVY